MNDHLKYKSAPITFVPFFSQLPDYLDSANLSREAAGKIICILLMECQFVSSSFDKTVVYRMLAIKSNHVECLTACKTILTTVLCKSFERHISPCVCCFIKHEIETAIMIAKVNWYCLKPSQNRPLCRVKTARNNILNLRSLMTPLHEKIDRLLNKWWSCF